MYTSHFGICLQPFVDIDSRPVLRVKHTNFLVFHGHSTNNAETLFVASRSGGWLYVLPSVLVV